MNGQLASDTDDATAGSSAWKRLPVGARLAIAAVGAVVALNAAARVVESSLGGSEPSGRTGSSYATAPRGLAAYAELLRRYDHPVERRRGALAGAIDPSATLYVIEPGTLAAEEVDTVSRFVRAGGRLVVGAEFPGSTIAALGDDPPGWEYGGPDRWTRVAESLRPVAEVESSGSGSWIDPGATTPLVENADGDRALLTLEVLGEGEILYLSDAWPIENRGIASADNAALALALAGDEGRPVVFAEGVHGYGATSGWRAIPSRWKTALAGLAAAALVLMWARGRRLGPPESASRPLAPPRREHVDALASTLARTRSFAATAAPVQDAVRRRLAARGGLGPDADDDDLARVAAATGMPDDEWRAALGPVHTAEELLAAGRALARLHGNDGRETR